MSLGCFSPAWFSGYDIALEFFFAIMSVSVALFALKVYKATNQKQTRLFGISFMFISLAYLTQALMNIIAFHEATEYVCPVMAMQSIMLYDTIGVFANILLMTIGLSTLTYMTLKTDKVRVLLLLMLLSLTALLTSRDIISAYFMISSLLLAIITWHFIDNHIKQKKKTSLMIMIAFIFLLLGRIHFLFSMNHQMFYALGHMLELVAYLLILWNFYLVLKK
jgi:hypothetical protein